MRFLTPPPEINIFLITEKRERNSVEMSERILVITPQILNWEEEISRV